MYVLKETTTNNNNFLMVGHVWLPSLNTIIYHSSSKSSDQRFVGAPMYKEATCHASSRPLDLGALTMVYMSCDVMVDSTP